MGIVKFIRKNGRIIPIVPRSNRTRINGLILPNAKHNLNRLNRLIARAEKIEDAISALPENSFKALPKIKGNPYLLGMAKMGGVSTILKHHKNVGSSWRSINPSIKAAKKILKNQFIGVDYLRLLNKVAVKARLLK